MTEEKLSHWICVCTWTSDSEIDRGWRTTGGLECKAATRAEAERIIRGMRRNVVIHAIHEWKPGQFAAMAAAIKASGNRKRRTKTKGKRRT